MAIKFGPAHVTALASEFQTNVPNEEAPEDQPPGTYVKLAFAGLNSVVITHEQALELRAWLATIALPPR